MIRTWEEVNSKLASFTGDMEREGKELRFPVKLRIDGWNWAQKMLCAHTPRSRKMDLVIDTHNRSAVLPDDFYAVEGVYHKGKEKWLRPMRRTPGDVMYVEDDLPEYWVWANSMYLEFRAEYETSDITLLYWAYYPDVEYDEEINLTQNQVYVPNWSVGGLLHLTMAYCWTPGAVMAADINEYKINVDAGNPLQNPRSQQAREHLYWWNVISDSFPHPQVVHTYGN